MVLFFLFALGLFRDNLTSYILALLPRRVVNLAANPASPIYRQEPPLLTPLDLVRAKFKGVIFFKGAN